MTQTTQREKIFRFITSRKQASAQEISNWFKIPVATARFHLRVLITEGRVLKARTERVRQLGKPRTIYQPVDRGGADIFRSLLDALLMESALVGVDMDQVIKFFAYQILPAPERRAGNLTLDLIDLIDRLNKRGYDARWEVHRASPTVILQECPYQNSLCRVSHFCEMDRRVISAWTHRNARLLKTAANGSFPNCVFEIE